jgi:hypothetical protein
VPARYLTTLLVLSACIKDPPARPPTLCTKDAECPTGQRCHESACIAGAGGDFAAELFAPVSRADLSARQEIDPLTIQAGQIDVTFNASIQVQGRVTLRAGQASAPSIAAKVAFHRSSRIPGARDYLVTVDALPGKMPGEIGFSVRLPPNVDGEDYDVTVYPDDGSLSPTTSPAPNTLCPPVTITNLHWRTSPAPQDIPCDTGGIHTVPGLILDSRGGGVAGVVVRAYSPTLISSTATSADDGSYTLYLSAAHADRFDMRLVPGPHAIGPSLTRRNVRPTHIGANYFVDPVRFPRYSDPVDFALPVLVTGTTPAASAQLHLSAVLSDDGTQALTYDTDATVGVDGLADVKLIPGAIGQPVQYLVTALPPQLSTGQSAWSVPISVEAPLDPNEALAPVVLGERAVVTGRVLDVAGRPVANMSVQPELADSFVATLSADQLADAARLSLPQTTTQADGNFSLHLDAKVVGLTATYDLQLVPPSSSVLPRWSQNGLTISSGVSSVNVGDIKLPAGSVASGVIHDGNGMPVADAEIRVYTLGDAMSRLSTLTTSGKDGTITLVLPSP